MTETASPEELLQSAMDHYRVGRLEKAKTDWDAVLAQDPDNYDALEWRGEIGIQQDEYDVAADCLQRCRDLDPERFQEYSNLGLAYYELEEAAKAVECLRKAIDVNPEDDVAHSNLGRALYDYFHAGHEVEAATLAREWAQAFPDNPDAAHMGAAVGGLPAPDKAVEAYVADVFDTFAPDFDEKLADLGYRAPQLLVDMIDEAGVDGKVDILDAGCGTGLCAPLLKPWARQLDGVDLSPRMLDKAEDRGLYDDLEERELVEYLKEHEGDYDLVIAADVFCYFGALDQAFKATRNTLRGAGLFAFSLERASDWDETYKLHPSGRYSHGETYVLQMVEQAGFDVLKKGHEVLRSEYGEDVHGLVVLARRR